MIRKHASADFDFCGGYRVPACASDRFSCACYRLLPVPALPADLNPICKPIQSHCAAGPAFVVRANDRTVVFLYRVSRSNPLAAILPRRCQPLVTRIFPSFEKRCAQPVKHPDPSLANVYAVYAKSALRHPPCAEPHRTSALGLMAMQPSRVDSVTGT